MKQNFFSDLTKKNHAVCYFHLQCFKRCFGLAMIMKCDCVTAGQTYQEADWPFCYTIGTVSREISS